MKKLKAMKKKTKRLILIIAAALILVLAALYTAVIKPLLSRTHLEYEETPVNEGALSVEVSESGNLELNIKNIDYDVDVNVSSDDDDDDDDDDEDEEEATPKYLEIEEVYAVAGSKVEAGDKLLKFTDESVVAVRKLLQNALTDAKVDYQDAESEYNLSVLEAETDLKEKELDADYSGSIYKYDKESINNNITLLEMDLDYRTKNVGSLGAAVDEAKADYDEALEAYNSANESFENSKSTDYEGTLNTLLRAQDTFERAESAYKEAVSKYDENNEKIESITTEIKYAKAKLKIELAASKEEYTEAQLYGDYAEILYKSTVEDLQEDLDDAEDTVEELEDRLEAFEALVGTDNIIYAPEKGTIVSAYYDEGDELETTGVIYTYATDENMTISVDVTEEDIVSLNVGDAVDVIFNAYSDKTYEGSIASINTTATSGDTPTVSYEVVVNVTGTLEELYGGMSAKINFITDTRENTLYVSRKAIVEENDKTYVYVKTGLNGKELREVTTGIKNQSYIEITDGITKDDTIYIATEVGGEE